MKRSRETGAVLLTVLLLVAVMAAVSVLALDRLKLATMLAGNAEASAQARADALGLEAAALARIDALKRSPLQNTRADWQGRPLLLPLPGGLATARLRDGGNCFNLNSLVANSDGFLAAAPQGRLQFLRLARLLEVPDGDAARIADSIVDWLDTDGSPTGAGGEDATYAGETPAYYAANRLMADVSELRALAGVTPDIYRKLRAHICTLPDANLSPINVNALTSDQAPLLAMLPPAMDAATARAILQSRPANGWQSIDQMPQAALFVDANLQTQPQYYRAELTIDRPAAQLAVSALIDARQQPARIIERRWGEE